MNLRQCIMTDNVWWRSISDANPNTVRLLNIANFLKNIRDFMLISSVYEDYIEDTADALRKLYTYECLCAELNITTGHLNKYEQYDWIEERYNDPTNFKVHNMYNATAFLFKYFPSPVKCYITVDKVKALHKIIGANGLITDAGEYRTTRVKPKGYNQYEYIHPEYISIQMSILIERTQVLLKEHYKQIEPTIKLAALVFTHFLHINPFSNGNGRVARLLLSYIISSVSVVPISLYSERISRRDYLECLSVSRQTEPFNPSALSTFIVESIERGLTCVAFY